MDFQFTPSNDFAFDENYHPILSLDQILPKENSESEVECLHNSFLTSFMKNCA